MILESFIYVLDGHCFEIYLSRGDSALPATWECQMYNTRLYHIATAGTIKNAIKLYHAGNQYSDLSIGEFLTKMLGGSISGH